jgi:hypothetical protein
MSLNCTGEKLPEEIQCIPKQATQISLDNFCVVTYHDDEILLYEEIINKDKAPLFYWVILNNDELPLGICNLEKYALLIKDWIGRKSDYLVIGSYNGRCYCIVIEMRHVLVKEEQEDDKFEQLKQSLTQLIQRENIILSSETLQKVYTEPKKLTYLGIIIAPGNTRNFNRKKLNYNVNIGDYVIPLRTLPKDALQNCKIKWTDLLKRLGVGFH